jgi:hypothetical protein
MLATERALPLSYRTSLVSVSALFAFGPCACKGIGDASESARPVNSSEVATRDSAGRASPLRQTSDALRPAEPRSLDRDALAKRLVAETKRDPRDGAWGSHMEATIRGVLKHALAPGSGLFLQSVYCASVRCALEGRGATRVTSEMLGEALRRVPDMPIASVRWTKLQDGTFEYRAILARTGYDVNGVRKTSL